MPILICEEKRWQFACKSQATAATPIETALKNKTEKARQNKLKRSTPWPEDGLRARPCEGDSGNYRLLHPFTFDGVHPMPQFPLLVECQQSQGSSKFLDGFLPRSQAVSLLINLRVIELRLASAFWLPQWTPHNLQLQVAHKRHHRATKGAESVKQLLLGFLFHNISFRVNNLRFQTS